MACAIFYDNVNGHSASYNPVPIIEFSPFIMTQRLMASTRIVRIKDRVSSELDKILRESSRCDRCLLIILEGDPRAIGQGGK